MDQRPDKKKPSRREYLSRRDRDTVAFIERYRLATPALLAAAGVAAEASSAARTLQKLARRGVVRLEPLTRRERYAVLTRRGRKLAGVEARSPRPFSEQSLAAALAIAWHAVRTGARRLTDREFRERFPELWRPGMRTSVHYLANTDGGPKLGVYLVDRGGAGRRVRGKLRRLFRQRAGLPSFVELARAGRVRLTILTGFPGQRQAVLQRLGGRLAYRGVEVEVVLVPELGEWLTEA